MRNMLILLFMVFALTSCAFFHVHKMDIEQGNVLTPEMISHVHKGMSKQQVQNILGEPILANVFNPNHMDYVYMFKPGYGQETIKYVTFQFRGNTLVGISGNTVVQ